MAWNTKRTIIAGVAGALLAVVAVVVFMNFITSEKQIQTSLEHHYGVSDPQFRREMGTLLGPAIIDGNRVQSLQNGDEIFPAMLAAIHSARLTITFETYIYWSGDIGWAFAEALAERARAGVKVHVLLDWLGSQKIDQAMIDDMTASGIEIQRYHPLSWSNLGRMNNRTHRKLLVVDGNVGFTGGVGIAESGTDTRRMPITGETRTTGWRGRPSPRCRRPSWTTGSRHRERWFRASNISRAGAGR